MEGAFQNEPPSAPTAGASYIVGAAPTGAWAGKAGQLASFGSGGRRFAVPVDGMSALLKDSGLRAAYHAGAWETGVVRASAVVIDGTPVLSTQSGVIASPNGGTIVDTQARATIDAILGALRHHGLILS